jgi:hypothetical protein
MHVPEKSPLLTTYEVSDVEEKVHAGLRELLKEMLNSLIYKRKSLSYCFLMIIFK